MGTAGGSAVPSYTDATEVFDAMGTPAEDRSRSFLSFVEGERGRVAASIGRLPAGMTA